MPKLLNIPKKLLPIIHRFNDFRLFLLEGGRGGAKSHSVARLLLYLGDKYKIRIACARETQNTIAESVHQLLAELIRTHQLNYEIQTNKIIHRTTGTEIIFKGLREQGRYNIKSLEGVDILWIEEGQVITKKTMDVVLPTIRKENSKIFVTMNRHELNDPAYTLLVNREDCIHIKISYLENEFCTTELIREADICKGMSERDYEHIWMGNPLAQGDDALYSIEDFENGKKNAHQLAKGYGLTVGAFDIARYGDDTCAVVILQQMGALHWEEIHCDEWEHKDLNYTTGRILMVTNEYGLDLAAIDEDGLGAGPFDTLTKGRRLDYFVGFRNPNISYQNNKSFVNPRTINAYKAKDMLMKGHLHIKTQKIIDEMLTIKYTFDHNQRRALVSKDKMRKDGIKSPNLADSVIMAVSLIGNVKEKQERQYDPQTQQQYSQEDNLFGIAGVR